MVKGIFNPDGQGSPELKISGGVFALIGIIVVADMMFNSGQVTLGLLQMVLG